MDLLEKLQSHPLFETFAPGALAEAVRLGTAVNYAPGDVCLHGDEAGKLFGVLTAGRLEAVRGYGTALRERIGTIEPGECFGEMSMLTGDPTNASVVALAESEAVVFHQEAISPLIAMNREAIQFLTKLIARRLTPTKESAAPAASATVRYSLGAAEPLRLLAVTCRRDDLRYAYFDTTSESALAWGRIGSLAEGEAVHLYHGPEGEGRRPVDRADHAAALEAALAALSSGTDPVLSSPADLSAVGHMVRHGGAEFNGPAVVDDEVKDRIRQLAALAPQDNPYNLIGIEECERLIPGVPQVAVFDTAFHRTLPEAACRYALPPDLAHDPELRRFGFHGISHEGAGRSAAESMGASFEALRLVTCHLGQGASLAAINHGRCVDTTMGFTPLEGLVMATRPGDLDPGLVLHLLRDRGVDPDELYERLFNEAGLFGLSCVSGDVIRITEEANRGNPMALLALQVFCLRARKHLSAYIGVLGGVDAIVFTGGVGENSAGARARICQGLDWMGIVLDEALNRSVRVEAGQTAAVSAPQSRARILVVGSDEQRTIAVHAVRALSHARVTAVMRRKERSIPIGTSAHHVHLTPEHVEALFGPGHTLTWHSDLTQPGQFACKEQVALVGPKGRIDRVRVLGPERPESQVEIARTEEFKLGIDAPIRLSGDLDGTPGILLEGPAGTVRLERGVICAMRHVHMSPQDAMGFAVRDRDVVRIRVPGERSLVFGDVCVRIRPDFRLDMHIDTDEANAAELSPGAVGYLDSIQQRGGA